MSEQPVVRLLAEGGCFEVFGRKNPEGQWVFRSRAFTMGEDADEWHGGSIPETFDLGEVVPEIWPRLTPRIVHPELRRWFAERLEPESMREMQRLQWQSLLESTPPDRWCDDDAWGS